jgi:MFS family permease
LSLIAGGITALALRQRVHHGGVILGGIVVGGVVFAWLGQIGHTALSATALAGVGLAGGLVISLVVAGIQARAPEALRGRVMGMYAITSQVVPALSGVMAGLMVHNVELTRAIATTGLALAGATLLAASRMTRLHRYSGA